MELEQKRKQKMKIGDLVACRFNENEIVLGIITGSRERRKGFGTDYPFEYLCNGVIITTGRLPRSRFIPLTSSAFSGLDTPWLDVQTVAWKDADRLDKWMVKARLWQGS